MKRKIIIAGFLIFVIPLLILVILYNVKADKTEMYNETEPENNSCINYRVLDSYGIPGHMKFSEIINSENIFKRYEKLLGDFNNAEKFRYIEVYNSLIQYDGFYENGETFIYGYDSFPDDWDIQEFINQEVKLEDGRQTLLTNINGAFISEKAFNEDFSLYNHIYRGKAFTSSDFIYSNEKINVLMGYDYINLYDVGNEISVLYLGYPVKLKIIGFLDNTSRIDMGDINIPLNTYILIPSFDIDNRDDEVNPNFSILHYSKKTRGFFKVIDNNIEAALNEFDDIINKSGLDYVYIPLSE